ncbi:MAG: hypothetical protein RLZZ298_571 [Pseudomonadota bacterium]|jgi:hypothetical protein
MNNGNIFLSSGLWSLFFAAIILYGFRKKIVNIFDPLSVFLIMRVSTLLAATLIIALTLTINGASILYFISVFLFVFVFYFSSKNIKYERNHVSDKQINFLNSIAFVFLFFKIVIIIASTGSLPIFSPGGSDASIQFNESNKISTTLLFGLGTGDLFIFAFTLPFVNKKILRNSVYFAIFISVLMIISGGKKSSLFYVGMAIFFADGFRSLISQNKKLYFFSKKNIFLLIGLSFVWASWVFLNTSIISDTYDLDLDMLLFIIDFTFSQWMTPYFIFNSPEFFNFINGYKVNELTYFFHSILKPLGYPAFDASIGPALHEYQTGELTGNGINPSFILEGFVIFGAAVPFYSMIVALFMAKARNKLLSIKKIEYRVIFISIYMNSLYALATDALSFTKALWASLIIIAFVVIPVRFLFFKRL